jgi:hypothetical protein
VRLGITPNIASGGCYVAVICRQGKPLVSIMDYHAPIPDETLHLQTSSYGAAHEVVELLNEFNIKTKGKAVIHADASSILRSESGQGSADLALDLSFRTDGTPYQYRVATRCEISCIVSGTVSVDRENYQISKQVGQRDHSWGVRNWWNMDWCWSSLHLLDGKQNLQLVAVLRKQEPTSTLSI